MHAVASRTNWDMLPEVTSQNVNSQNVNSQIVNSQNVNFPSTQLL